MQSHFAHDKTLVANACSPVVDSNLFLPQRKTPLQHPQYIPTPNAACVSQLQQPTPAPATQQISSSVPPLTATVPAVATPGTPILDENILQLDDDFADFLNEKPVTSVV